MANGSSGNAAWGHLTRPSTQDTTSAGPTAASTPSASSTNEDRKTQARLAELLDRNMARVDHVEKMPSPYMWETLQDMEDRLKVLRTHVESLNQQLGQQRVGDGGNIDVTEIVKLQDQAIVKAGYDLASMHEKVDSLRRTYRTYEKGDNVLEMADRAERARQEQLDNDLKLKMIQTIPQPGQPGTPAPAFGAPSPAATPASGSIFGGFGATTSAFGSTPAAPKPAFGAAPAPGTSLFGTPAAPAPSTGGSLFGGTPAAPAPATGASLFGGTPAGAPATAFGATTPAPAAFGAAPPTTFGAAAPIAAPAFGAAAPAAGAPTFNFASTTSTATTPKSKNKSRSSRRR